METKNGASNDWWSVLGTFEGFNFRDQCAIVGELTAADVIGWDHDKKGEAEFWPSGDCPLVRVVFGGRNHISSSALNRLQALLSEVCFDFEDAMLRIHFLVNVQGESLEELTPAKIEECDVQLFAGDSFIRARINAAYDLFQIYWPELFAAWEKSPLDGLRFDPDEFLDSPSWTVEEVDLGAFKWVLVSPV